ncbi:MAG: hypothetical protein ACOCWY_04525 [Thermodesulfobacteriota bacterium]
MATRELLFDLFRKRLEELANEKGLSNPEKEAVIETLRHAMANPYMTEDQIYRDLIRKTSG